MPAASTVDVPLPGTKLPQGSIRMAGKPDSMIDSISCLQKPVPSEFAILVKELEKHRANGVRCPLRSTVAVELMKRDALAYRKAGVHTFKDYVALAVQAKIVTVGGGMQIATTHFHRNNHNGIFSVRFPF